MPKSVEIAEFAGKIALVAKRLNWSRLRLAQAVGIDKSLVARWMKGASLPTANSLMQLTQAVGREIAGFSAADWDRAPVEFARAVGLDPAAAAPSTAGAEPAGIAEDAMSIGLAEFANGFAHYAAMLSGFYWRYGVSPRNDGAILQRALRIWPDQTALRYETVSVDFPMRGYCWAHRSVINFIGQQPPHGIVAFGKVNASGSAQPRLLTGVFCGEIVSNERAVFATKAALQFVERLSGDPRVDERRWRELIEGNRRIGPEQDLRAMLGPELADFFALGEERDGAKPGRERLYVARPASP